MSTPDEMHDQRETNCQRGTRGNQDGASRAILDDPDPGMTLRMQVVGQMLQGGVEELRGNHRTTRQQHESPPQRLDSQHDQSDHHGYQGTQLESEIGLTAPGGRQTGYGTPQPADEGLVLMYGHRAQ
jgi:hypothetical protein